MINFNAISKSFDGQLIVRDLSLQIKSKKIYTFFGPNGCGKSTLMNLLSGLYQPDTGSIEGQSKLAGKIGYVFQDYRRHLLPWLSARENILFPLKLRHISPAICEERLAELLKIVPVSFDLSQSVLTLSGGQAQLTSLLRALIIEPELLILDEPFSALDYTTTHNLRAIVLEVARAYHLTVLFISHDLDEAIYLGDHAVFLTRRPSHIHCVLDINGPEKREPSWTTEPDFIDLKRRALGIIKQLD